MDTLQETSLSDMQPELEQLARCCSAKEIDVCLKGKKVQLDFRGQGLEALHVEVPDNGTIFSQMFKYRCVLSFDALHRDGHDYYGEDRDCLGAIETLLERGAMFDEVTLRRWLNNQRFTVFKRFTVYVDCISEKWRTKPARHMRALHDAVKAGEDLVCAHMRLSNANRAMALRKAITFGDVAAMPSPNWELVRRPKRKRAKGTFSIALLGDAILSKIAAYL